MAIVFRFKDVDKASRDKRIHDFSMALRGSPGFRSDEICVGEDLFKDDETVLVVGDHNDHDVEVTVTESHYNPWKGA